MPFENVNQNPSKAKTMCACNFFKYLMRLYTFVYTLCIVLIKKMGCIWKMTSTNASSIFMKFNLQNANSTKIPESKKKETMNLILNFQRRKGRSFLYSLIKQVLLFSKFVFFFFQRRLNLRGHLFLNSYYYFFFNIENIS